MKDPIRIKLIYWEWQTPRYKVAVESRPDEFKSRKCMQEGSVPTYLVVIGKTSTGYSAHCPDVLGCAAVGKTLEKVVASMKERWSSTSKVWLKMVTRFQNPAASLRIERR